MDKRLICWAVLCCILGRLDTAVSAPVREKDDSSDAFFTDHTIPRIRIRLDQEALAALRNKFREYTKATVMDLGGHGHVFGPAKVRSEGHGA